MSIPLFSYPLNRKTERRVRRRVFAASLAVLLLGLAFTVVAGCKRDVEEQVDSRISRELPRYLGPADRYTTHIDLASSDAILRGRVRTVEIIGDNVHLRPNLVVDRLMITVHDVEIDTKKKKLENIGGADLVASISGDNLNQYLQSRHINVRDLSVGISGDRLNLRGRPEVLGIAQVPASVRGIIVPTRSGDQLNFEPDRGAVSIIPVPGAALSYLARKVNPIVDLTRLQVPINVSSVTISNGQLTMVGTVDSESLLSFAK